MILKFKMHFELRAYGRKGVYYDIRLRVSYDGRRVTRSSGCQVSSPDAWDDDAQLVVSGYKGPNGETDLSINRELRIMSDNMLSAIRYFEANDIMPTEKELAAKYDERIKGVRPQRKEEKEIKEVKGRNGSLEKQGFFDVFDMFMEESGEMNAWTKATFQKMDSMKTDLLAFNKNLKFEDLNDTTLSKFVAYLRDSKCLRTPRKAKGDRKDYDKDDITGLKNTTIKKKLGYLKWFLKWATIKGYNKNTAYQAFKPTLKMAQKTVIYLTQEELEKLQKLQIPKQHAALEQIRDVLFFCCFSGLRHSDVLNLKRANIKGDSISITTVKTADKLTIELNNVTRSILEKYKDFKFKDGRALPVISNQPMNRAVKELCKMAGINEEYTLTTYRGNKRTDVVKQKWELVGTHTGRRTFIVTALSNGTPPNVVMKWTGHSDYKSMQPYIDIVDTIKAKEMEKFNSFSLV